MQRRFFWGKAIFNLFVFCQEEFRKKRTSSKKLEQTLTKENTDKLRVIHGKQTFETLNHPEKNSKN